MIDVEQHPLGTFIQDVMSLCIYLVQQFSDVRNKRNDLCRHFQSFLKQASVIQAFLAVVTGKDKIMVVQHLLQSNCESLRMQQVSNPQSAARDLVFVGRSDTSSGCADRLLAPAFFPGLVQFLMIWQDQSAGFTDTQTLSDRYPLGFKRFKFLNK